MNKETMQYSTYSQNIYRTFLKNTYYRRFVSVLYILLTCTYLSWRLTTLNEDHLSISLIYYFAELMGFMLGLVIIYNSWKITYSPAKYSNKKYVVDVFVPTYKEDIEIIKKTLTAAKNITYPHETWLLDDANRNEVRQLAKSLDINYLTREENIGAKAGNLNNAFQHSSAELLAVFDADHIPQPNAIEKLLGYFDDDQLAMVQTPQDYYNADAFQYMNSRNSKQHWHDQSFFYNISMSCSNSHNAASCVGTGVIYRKSSLLDIGGIPSSTVTEDIHTSLKLHKAGYQTVYVNEPIAYGLAATDLEEYYTTRHRWAHGNISALKEEKVLSCEGLTWKQRLSYLSLGLIYLEGWQQLILFIIPVVTLFLGIPPFEISLLNILVILLFPISTYLMLQEIGSGFSRFWSNEIYSMIRWPVHVFASLAFVGKKLQWKSSKKKIKGDIDIKLMLPQLGVLLISMAAVSFAVNKVIQDPDPVTGPIYEYTSNVVAGKQSINLESMSITMADGYSVELVLVAGFWALFNMFKVLLFIIKVVRSARASNLELYFSLRLPFKLNQQTLFCDKVSENTLLIRQNLNIQENSVEDIELILPTGTLAAQITFHKVDSKSLKGTFIWGEDSDQKMLSNLLHSPDWYRDAFSRNSVFLTPREFLLYPLKRLFNKVARSLRWQSAVLTASSSADSKEEYLCLIGMGKRDFSLICFQKLPISSTIEINAKKYKIKALEPITSLPGKGLHGSYHYRYSIALYAESMRIQPQLESISTRLRHLAGEK